MSTTIIWHLAISLTVFAAAFLFVYAGWPWGAALVQRQERWYERVLIQQLLLDISPRSAVALAWGGMLVMGSVFYIVGESVIWFVLGTVAGGFAPNLVVHHLELKRRQRLEFQLVDTVTTLASAMRANLNMVQAFELLVTNSIGPIRQEFAQLLREYDMGLDLGKAMQNAAKRIGSSHYRLLFTPLQKHRRRGGNVGETLDSLAESIREIQRLEGKLDALTAQGRSQARMMAAMPVVLLGVIYLIEPEGVEALFAEPMGRFILASAVLMIAGAFWWIRRIMTVDI